MADPHIGLLSFQQAMTEGIIAPEPARFDRKLLLLADKPDDNIRSTYALGEHSTVKGIAVFVPASSYGRERQFSVGFAAAELYRGEGVATELLIRAVNVLRQGLASANFWLEAIVSKQNLASG